MNSEATTTARRNVDLKANIGGTAVVALISILVVLSQTVGPVDAAGSPIGVIAPALWNSGALYLVFFFTAAALFIDHAARTAGWDLRLAAANAGLSVLFVVPVIWLASSGGLFNDAFFGAIGWPGGVTLATWVVAILSAAMAVQGTFNGFARAFAKARS
ncbi:MAG TPA: hypothetical protein VFD39_09040 [Trueperaceae bacterium]|nr:hypothetical protein [Trueperaceae bacterium]